MKRIIALMLMTTPVSASTVDADSFFSIFGVSKLEIRQFEQNDPFIVERQGNFMLTLTPACGGCHNSVPTSKYGTAAHDLSITMLAFEQKAGDVFEIYNVHPPDITNAIARGAAAVWWCVSPNVAWL